MTIELGSGGLPMCGRTRSSLAEIQAQFVDHPGFVVSTSRATIWAAFLRATEMLREVLPISAMWIGGSFVTDKPDPSDIDVLYIVSAQDYAQLQGDQALKRLAVFSENGALMKRGIPVDCSVLVWNAIAEPQPDNPEHIPYLKWRGYWDDFLQRHTIDKTKTPTRSSSIPARGYLEVIDSDFTT